MSKNTLPKPDFNSIVDGQKTDSNSTHLKSPPNIKVQHAAAKKKQR